ncbi:hypothetical protein [Streptomyces sp. NPDC088760]|uniref:hypothetical protein n=1 Tax=Streptomyces sp. NPDC088760 TaxID=3365890 RepID=UPI00382C7447
MSATVGPWDSTEGSGTAEGIVTSAAIARCSRPGFLPEARDYKAQIQVRVGHRKGWRPLLTFSLRAANIIDPDRYTVYNNAPLELTKEDQKRADAALLELLEEHGDGSPPGGRRREEPPDDGDADTSG